MALDPHRLMSQPFRAGLTFDYRPYGPGSICDSLRVLTQTPQPLSFGLAAKRLKSFPDTKRKNEAGFLLETSFDGWMKGMDLFYGPRG